MAVVGIIFFSIFLDIDGQSLRLRGSAINWWLFFLSVYLMLADFYEYEGLMVALKLKGLLDTGEYIVVGVDSKDYDYEDPHKYVEGDKKYVL